MGKGQSKHGQCYLVNAHFNPLCQLEDTNSLQSVETPLTSQDSGLQLTPEISFTLSEDDKSNWDKKISKKCAFEVFLPQETVKAALKDSVMDVKLQNINDEPSRKEQQKVTLECVKNNNHSKQQEFSFVLRNYSGQEADKEDAEKVVLHSICDALKSSLRLPPSGSGTLRVHLTVSPDSDKDMTIQKPATEENAPCERIACSETGVSANISKTLGHQTADKLASTPFSSPAKHCSLYARCCQQETVTNRTRSPLHDGQHDVLSSPYSRRHRLFTDRKDSQKWMDALQIGKKDNVLPNFKSSPQHSISRERQHHHHNEQPFGTRECSHYLDLADMKISDPKDDQDRCDLRHLNPAYCSPRHLEKNHKLCHFQKHSHSQKKKSSLHHKAHESELHSGILKYKLLQKAKNNMLDLSFDLCDLEDKQTEVPQPHHQHRRSRSYDTNQYSLVNSPNLRHRSCNCPKCVAHYIDLPQSPGRHHRHCHRKREKDKLRAMEQVARWLDKEELNQAKQQQQGSSNDLSTSSQKDGVVERHEYHHIHEHHHYYHYVDP